MTAGILPRRRYGMERKSDVKLFLYVNISPKLPAFNRGIRVKLEAQVRA